MYRRYNLLRVYDCIARAKYVLRHRTTPRKTLRHSIIAGKTLRHSITTRKTAAQHNRRKDTAAQYNCRSDTSSVLHSIAYRPILRSGGNGERCLHLSQKRVTSCLRSAKFVRAGLVVSSIFVSSRASVSWNSSCE